MSQALGPQPSQELSPAGWLGVVGTVAVALAALGGEYGLSEQNIFLFWLGGVTFQIVAGLTAIYQRRAARALG
jgi:hypothetical protein